MKAWFLSWFGGAPIDKAPAAPELYRAGPLTVDRVGEGFIVRQEVGGAVPGVKSWTFASADAMRRQLEEFGGAATAPEVRAALESAGELVERAPVELVEPVDLSRWEA